MIRTFFVAYNCPESLHVEELPKMEYGLPSTLEVDILKTVNIKFFQAPTMSEYQYYYFEAIDKPLTDQQQKELRAISTRAEIDTRRFVNEYHFGDFTDLT